MVLPVRDIDPAIDRIKVARAPLRAIRVVILTKRMSAMSNPRVLAHLIPVTILGTAGTTVAALLVACTALTIAPGAADAKPSFTQETGKACGFCHGNPPELNDQGKKFKANGNKL